MNPRGHYISLLIPALLFLALLVPLRGGFTDDGFIHIQYARNIMTRGEYSFNPGVVSFGTTSPLWVLLQAFLGLVSGGPAVLIETSRAVSWLSGFLALGALFALGKKLSGDWFVAFLSACVFACDAWFARWTAMSMETSTAALAAVLMGLASVEAGTDKRSALFLGFLLAITSLLRPEAYLFFPVYVFSLFFMKGKLDSRCAARVIAVFLALMIPWLLFAKLHIGSFLPNTAAAKSGGLVTNPIVFIKKFSPIVKIIGSTQALWVLFILASIIRKGRSSRILAGDSLFILFCIIALPLAYVLFDMQVLSRYLLLITPFIAVFGVISANEIMKSFRPLKTPRQVVLGGIASVSIVISVTFYFIVVVPPSKGFSRDLTHELRDLALYINKNSGKDAVVAAADIGYLAFYSRRKVLDLGGLVEPVTGKLREEYTYEEIIESGLFLELPEYPRVDYFVDRELAARRFEGKILKGYSFEPVLVKVVDNLGIRKPGPYYYTLYRLRKVSENKTSSEIPES